MNRCSPITTHVLDTAHGCPAAGIRVTLSHRVSDTDAWAEIARSETNLDGRVEDLLKAGSLAAGAYRLAFATAAYFDKLDIETLFPVVTIDFFISVDAIGQHFHVPLLLSPFGYSTYRGS